LAFYFLALNLGFTLTAVEHALTVNRISTMAYVLAACRSAGEQTPIVARIVGDK